MEPIVNQVHELLIKNKKTISVAESCTGGLISFLLTQVSGSSAYFNLGLVNYSNEAKNRILKIPSSLIAKKGAVSKEVARKMAQSCRKIAKTDLGLSITGIAGPTGATPDKPIGTVFIAVSSSKITVCNKFRFTGNRGRIRKQAALKSLEMLKKLI
ncbi:MAG: CinA family protein [Candidatus Omnitrophota bacterium]